MKKLKIPKEFSEQINSIRVMNAASNTLVDVQVKLLSQQMQLNNEQDAEILWDYIINGSDWMVDEETDEKETVVTKIKFNKQQILTDMCLTYRHDYFLDKTPGTFSSGMSNEEREHIANTMSQLLNVVLAHVDETEYLSQ